MIPSPTILTTIAFALLVLLPVMASWMIVLVPSRKREATGISLGNTLNTAPLAPAVPIVTHPLIHLSRSLSGTDIEGYILGLRHLPVEDGAPLLSRFVNGNDPALQLYAQGILQQGRDDLAARFHELLALSPEDPRAAAWLLETGLRLAHPSLCGATERPGFVKYLVSLAAHRLQVADPSPALLANAAQIFLEAKLIDEAATAMALLPKDCGTYSDLQSTIGYLRHQKALVA